MKVYRTHDPLILAALTSLWLASVGNLALWLALYRLPDVAGARGLALGLGIGVALAALLMLLQAPFAGARFSKVLAALLLLITAPTCYFMLAYGVVIDPSMMRNTAQTHTAEVLDLLSWPFMLCVALLALLPIAFIWRWPLARVPAPRRLLRNALASLLALVVAAAALLASLGDLAPLMRNQKGLRYMATPLNVLYASARLVSTGSHERTLTVDDASPHLAHAMPAAPLVPVLVLVVGETARADRFSINGYARKTSPRMQARGVLSFTNVHSCGTNTADSVPCMFSHLGREQFFGQTTDHENLLDILRRTGYEVLWLDNNSGCKGVCARVPSQDMNNAKHPTLCSSEGCFDEILADGLGARIKAMSAANPKTKGVVVVLHQVGSHGPAYYKRSPQGAKRFLPECQTNVLQQCSVEEIGNAYDNSIAYTDLVLDRVIEELSQLPKPLAPGMIYVSDHGESLGEGNNYLHGLPYAIAPEVQKHVPMFMWMSPGLLAWRNIEPACLKQQTPNAFSHDNLYHTVLELMDVSSTTYQEAKDILEPCEKAGSDVSQHNTAKEKP
jgi:lipid A ethanolaminephosphotransferase